MKRLILHWATVVCQFILLLHFTAFTTTAQDDTVYVDGGIYPGANESGSVSRPFNTITEGLNAAGVGQSVSIAAGTYYDAMTMTKPVTLIATGGTVTIVGREDLTFSVLAINLHGIHSSYGDDHVSWQDRYGRIANWMVTTNKIPDLIALQEVHGQSGHVKQYETLFTLVTKIREQTNVTYRIAYLIVRPVPQGLRPTLWSGLALLYNPDRVTNKTTSNPFPSHMIPNFNDETVLVVHPRKSLPCQTAPEALQALCSQIDREELSWISSYRSTKNGRWINGPAFARFELTSSPGSYIHIYNIHINWDEPPSSSEGGKVFQDLVTNMEILFGDARLYPPVILGDFNISSSDMHEKEILQGGIFEAFKIAGYVDRDVMGVLVGKDSTFPSQQQANFEQLIAPEDIVDPATRRRSSCGRVGILWSDHCAIFVRFSPASN